MTLQDQLSFYRAASGLKTAFICEQIGCHRQQLWEWTAGRTMPRIDTVVRLAKLYGLTEAQRLQLYESEIKLTKKPHETEETK